MSAPQSPFVGLAAFTPRAAAYFTGRERFAVTLAGAILRSRVTVLYGQSGSGKSSVLGAALPQAMRATLRRAAETTQRAPFRLLHFRRWHPGFETRLYRAAAAKLAASGDSSLATAVRGWGEEQKAPMILVLDQFEEFLLYHPRPTETDFVQNLATVVADPDIEARVLLSVREDSLASLDALRAVIPGILSSPVQLRPLDRTAAEQAIRRPVAKWSEEKFGDSRAVEVEDTLVETLLDQVKQTGSGTLNTGAMPNPVAEFRRAAFVAARLGADLGRGGKGGASRPAAANARSARRRCGHRPATFGPNPGSPPGGAAGIGDPSIPTSGDGHRRKARMARRRSCRGDRRRQSGRAAGGRPGGERGWRNERRGPKSVGHRRGRRRGGGDESGCSRHPQSARAGEGADPVHAAGPTRPGSAVRALPRCSRSPGAVLGARGSHSRSRASPFGVIHPLSASSTSGSSRGFCLGPPSEWARRCNDRHVGGARSAAEGSRQPRPPDQQCRVRGASGCMAAQS